MFHQSKTRRLCSENVSFGLSNENTLETGEEDIILQWRTVVHCGNILNLSTVQRAALKAHALKSIKCMHLTQRIQTGTHSVIVFPGSILP